MKILLITMEYPPMHGGVGNYYFNLVKNLPDFDVQILLADKSKFYKYFWPRWLKLFFEIKKVVKNEKIDLIWVGQVLPVGEAVYLIKKFFKIPYFVSTHGMDIMLPQKKLRKQIAMMKVLDQSEFITANSQFTKEQMIKLGISDEKVEVIYPCACISRKHENTKTLKQIDNVRDRFDLNGKKVLLSVGRLVERKGQDMVIKVIPRLLKKFPDLVYLMVGKGPLKENYELRIKDKGIFDSVKIISDVLNDELSAYYELADIFVMPSRDIKGDVEGFGIVYLEANSFGLPVIAGRSGGVMEAVIDGQTGLLVNPEDEHDIYEKIVKLLSDKELYNKLSENGKMRVESEFQWLKQAEVLKNRIKKLT